MDLRYPIGPFEFKGPLNDQQRQQFIDQIEQTPANMRTAVAGLSNEQIDTPYRPEGWTVRQVVHHVPDSHLNSYVRFKLALTEDQKNANCAACDPQPTPVPAGTVGLFEGADYYHCCGVYRPEFNCRMRSLNNPFCAVCQQVIVKKLTPFLPT